MKKLNPALKLIALSAVTFELAFLKNYILNLAVFVLSIIAVSVLSRDSLKKCAVLMIPVLLAASGMFFAGYRFSSGGGMPLNEETLLLSEVRIINALILSSRVTAFSGVLFLFSFTTDRVQLIRSLHVQLHLPSVFAYGILAAYGIFPYMLKEYRRVTVSFKNRGIRAFPVSPKILKPVLVKAVRWSEVLSMAMESKGFDPQKKRECYRPPKIKTADIVFVLLCVTLPIFVNFLLN